MKKLILALIVSAYMMHLHAQKISVLKDIQHAEESSYPDYLMMAKNKLFFAAEDSAHGNELWMSDGTRSTTHLALDLNPGPEGSYPQKLIYMSGSLYFPANDGVSGRELWKLNLANMVIKKLTNTSVSSPFGFEDGYIVYNNHLYFSFDDGVHGSELWETDGTVAGTGLVKDMRPGTLHTRPRQFLIFKNKLFFVGEDDIDTQALYVINGIAKPKKFFNCGEEGCSALTAFSNMLYFFSDDQVFSSPRNELYVTDGTTTGTHIVKQINPNGPGTYFDAITISNNQLFFAANDGVHGIELWKSDGTANGTKMVKDIASGTKDGVPSDMIAYKNKVIFQAYQQPASGATWITDGTKAGTIKLSSDMLVSNSGGNFIGADNKLFFVAYVNGFGFELCTTDGTPAGTKLAYDINKGAWTSYPDRFTPRDSSLFFVATDDKKGYEVFSLSPLEFTVASAENNFADAYKEVVEDAGVSLSQNSPNPFTGTTSIGYTLPVTYKTAALVFSGASGHIIKMIQLNHSGANHINVNAKDLSPGIYFYSLVTDGKIMSTKKCIIGR